MHEMFVLRLGRESGIEGHATGFAKPGTGKVSCAKISLSRSLFLLHVNEVAGQLLY